MSNDKNIEWIKNFLLEQSLIEDEFICNIKVRKILSILEEELKLIEKSDEENSMEKLIFLKEEKINDYLFKLNKKYIERLVSTRRGVDYNLNLMSREKLIDFNVYPNLYNFLVALPQVKNEGLTNENHGMGYHIHYIVIKKKKENRTNVIFTFNPNEELDEKNKEKHKLYWEFHSGGLAKSPNKFGKKRRNAIYDTSCGFLSSVSLNEFRSPSTKSKILWPL